MLPGSFFSPFLEVWQYCTSLNFLLLFYSAALFENSVAEQKITEAEGKKERVGGLPPAPLLPEIGTVLLEETACSSPCREFLPPSAVASSPPGGARGICPA